jgi:hypothetical protein
MRVDELKLILTLKGKRYPQYEERIFKNKKLALFYFRTCLNMYGTDLSEMICDYARFEIKGRWPAAEHIIKNDIRCIYFYSLHVIGGRWLEAEHVVRRSEAWTFYYTLDVIKDRWPEAELDILASEYKHIYLTFIQRLYDN